MRKANTIEEYLDLLPPASRKHVLTIQKTIRQEVPDAMGVISYGIPCYKRNGRFLIYFAGYKAHVSIYPVPAREPAFEKDFAKYHTSGKGTIQFPLDQPLPLPLIRRIIHYLKTHNEIRTAAQKRLPDAGNARVRNLGSKTQGDQSAQKKKLAGNIRANIRIIAHSPLYDPI